MRVDIDDVRAIIRVLRAAGATRETLATVLQQLADGTPARNSLTTTELASALGIKAGTICRALSQEGHYFGLTPTKLPNRRLRWPGDSVEILSRARSK